MSGVIDKTKPICVTGASGFIATHIVEQLLQEGYKVNGTVRDSSPEGLKRYTHLTDLPGADTNLTLFSVCNFNFLWHGLILFSDLG